MVEREPGSTQRPTIPTPSVAVSTAEPSNPEPVGRYEIGRVLARGGMGEVWVADDPRIGRSVAMKLLLPALEDDADGRRRFYREARVQGQLEHPAIVPVYDYGTAADGRPYFTMKRIEGRTLREVLHDLAVANVRVVSRRLLTAFSTVCAAVDHAHRRGVVHRDLKPENIMLGDHGEVYVLDWGVAKLEHGNDADAVALDVGRAPLTTGGMVLGTPEYMAPEQRRGEATLQSDVFALGAVLHEILTLEPFVEGEPPDAPPELAAACMRATAQVPADRFASAGDLREVVEVYLDGDRDLALRRRLAVEHAEAAGAAARRALGPRGTLEDRRVAAREAARALALDPERDDALAPLVELLAHPPRELPAEAQRRLSAARDARARSMGVPGAIGFLVYFVGYALMLWMGLRSTLAFGVGVGLTFLAVISSLASNRLHLPRGRVLASRYVLAIVVASMASLTFGPFVLAPGLIAIHAMAYALHGDGTNRWVIAPIGMMGVLVPLGLELVGLLPRSFAFREGVLVLLPRLHEHPRLPSLVFLVAMNVGLIIAAALYTGSLRANLDRGERLEAYTAWQLGALLGRG